MKNIILMGASRAGKSTFTKMLGKNFDNLMIIRTDIFRLAFREAIIKDLKLNTSLLKDNMDYRNFVLSYYKYVNKYETDYIKVVDTVDFEPKDLNCFEDALIICFGYPKAKREEIVNNWHKYDTDLDWTKNKKEEDLLDFAQKEIQKSKYLKDECEKYRVKFVDTSFDRERILNQLLEDVKASFL